MTDGVRRREALAGIGAAVASAGCVGRIRNIAGRERSSQLVLEILVLPTDSDPNGIRIARSVSEHLNAVGIGTRIETIASTELRRDTLINHDFDVYVGQYKEAEPFDPDALYGLLHSRFTAESGWQNPFGLTEVAIDDLLEEQRTVPDGDRTEVVAELQRRICDLQPFTVVAFPDALSAVQTDRFTEWDTDRPVSLGGLLSVERAGSDRSEASTTLRLVTTDERITANWNPIAAEHRRHGTFTSLLYDRLVETHDDETIPWLARDWERIDEETLRVTLRDATWHDGTPITASDVAFTYTFLRDTSMGETETAVPAPQFRGRSVTVEDSTVVDDSTVDLSIGTVNEAVAERTLQVPVLPEHVWSELTGPATIAGFEFDEGTTEALVSNNEDPVGSGPMRFVDSTAETSVTFERNPDHFLLRGANTSTDAVGMETEMTGEDGGTESATDSDESADVNAVEGIPDTYRGKPAFDRLEIEVVGSDVAAVQLVGDGFADATASNLGPDAVPRVGREADATLVSGRSAAFYHVGYNTRQAPLSNFQFRQILAALVDKATLVDDAFTGYARPAASTLAASPEWVPEDLAWTDGRDPVHPFYHADESDSELDIERVQNALRDAGYWFNERGELVTRS